MVAAKAQLGSEVGQTCNTASPRQAVSQTFSAIDPKARVVVFLEASVTHCGWDMSSPCLWSNQASRKPRNPRWSEWGWGMRRAPQPGARQRKSCFGLGVRRPTELTQVVQANGRKGVPPGGSSVCRGRGWKDWMLCPHFPAAKTGRGVETRPKLRAGGLRGSREASACPASTDRETHTQRLEGGGCAPYLELQITVQKVWMVDLGPLVLGQGWT